MRPPGAFVNHPRGVRFDASGRLRVSSIYDWFRSDFGDSDGDLLAHLKRHAAPGLRARLERVDLVHGHDYDWALNAAP